MSQPDNWPELFALWCEVAMREHPNGTRTELAEAVARQAFEAGALLARGEQQ